MTTGVFSFNPLESPHLENPYPLYARAQREAPIFFSPLFATWVVTRYEDVRAILPPEVGVLVNEDPRATGAPAR